MTELEYDPIVAVDCSDRAYCDEQDPSGKKCQFYHHCFNKLKESTKK